MRLVLIVCVVLLAMTACNPDPVPRRNGRAMAPDDPEPAPAAPPSGAAPRDAATRGPVMADASVAADAAPEVAADLRAPPPDALDARGDSAVVVGGDPGACRFRLCETFEDYADGAPPSAAIWTTARGVRVDSTRAARGKKALRITTGLDQGEWFIRETRTFATPTAPFYVRAFFWIDRQPRSYVHWTLFEASAVAQGWGWVARYGAQQFAGAPGAAWIFNIETHGQGETALLDTNAVPAKTWNCVEAFYNPPKNEADFWSNGQERPRVHWRNNMPADARFTFRPLHSLSIGWAYYGTVDAPFDVWIDEIAIADERIGCDR